MKNPIKQRVIFFICAGVFSGVVQAQYVNPNPIGLALLRDLNTNLNGAGIRVGQPEAAADTNGDWEVNPADVPASATLFTYFSNGVSSTTFPNSLGGESGHADVVGNIFYSPSGGSATNVAKVDNFEAGYYFNDLIAIKRSVPGNITDVVVNQSFTFGSLDADTQKMVDSAYDDYSVGFNTFFISAACNYSISPSVCAPGTSYNCISVGAYGGDSSIGPTIDNGRCKPDITAPQNETSFSAPQVAGAAALLMQAALRRDGGPETNSAANMITIKALLMNGAVKPSDWTNLPPAPLDFRYGAGVLNVFNSYEELAFGKHGYVFSSNIPMGTAHPPVVVTASVPVLSGWDFNTNTSTSSMDGVNHYFFNITNTSRFGAFTLASTLVWNRHEDETNINDLALFLYNVANSNLMAASTSMVDNVQHIFVPHLSQGRYDLQVWKAGGGSIVSGSEPYALAWQMASVSLVVTGSGTSICLSWPAYPAGFAVAETPSLSPPISWSTNNIPPSVYTKGENLVWLNTTNSEEFFRLQTPDF